MASIEPVEVKLSVENARWEYFTIFLGNETSGGRFQDCLNEMGLLTWELVQIIKTSTGYVGIFKRIKEYGNLHPK